MDISLEGMLHAVALGKNGQWGINRDLNRVEIAPSVTTHGSKYDGGDSRCVIFTVNDDWRENKVFNGLKRSFAGTDLHAKSKYL